MTKNLKLLSLAIACGALVLAGCGSDDGAGVRDGGGASGSGPGSASQPLDEAKCVPVGDPADADTTVEVQLTDFAVLPQRSTIPAGTVAFAARNTGDEAHELLIVRGGDASQLETDADGAVVEDSLGDAVVGEISPFPAGESCTGVFDLAPGDHLLLCNIVETLDDGTVESHFAMGMHTVVTVG